MAVMSLYITVQVRYQYEYEYFPAHAAQWLPYALLGLFIADCWPPRFGTRSSTSASPVGHVPVDVVGVAGVAAAGELDARKAQS